MGKISNMIEEIFKMVDEAQAYQGVWKHISF